MPDVAIAGPIAEPHPADACYGSRLHCWSHDADEPGEPASVCPAQGFPLCCYECRHLFLTAADLLAAHNAEMTRLGLPAETDAARVFCCPFCIHDW
jgi:hypothetical protein